MATLATLRTEFQARGFDFDSAARVDAWINRAYMELAEEEEWPWLYTTTSGAAPLAVSDVRMIESVIDTTTGVKLVPLDRRHLTDISNDLAITGSPTFYYFSAESTIDVYPAATDTLAVRYWKVPAELSADGDTPLLPSRFHQLLVDGALVFGYYDTDNFEAALQCRDLFESGKARMRESLMVRQADRPDDFVTQTSAHEYT